MVARRRRKTQTTSSEESKVGALASRARNNVAPLPCSHTTTRPGRSQHKQLWASTGNTFMASECIRAKFKSIDLPLHATIMSRQLRACSRAGPLWVPGASLLHSASRANLSSSGRCAFASFATATAAASYPISHTTGTKCKGASMAPNRLATGEEARIVRVGAKLSQIIVKIVQFGSGEPRAH